MGKFSACMVIVALLGAPLAAQEAAPQPAAGGSTERKADAEAPKAAEEAKDEKREMGDEAKKLFADVKLVYAKYYEILLAKTKGNEAYKVEEVWETAIKEAKNATYKDLKAWEVAVVDMKKKDRVFKKEFVELVNKLANEHAEAVRKWAAENGK
ncbi:MAG: hypothetical protein IT463_15020 [Planctomycetes bacterium]|nr:hypothetical protein [Planctomycetota bacterium]